jgi:hypothetical protein
MVAAVLFSLATLSGVGDGHLRTFSLDNEYKFGFCSWKALALVKDEA